MLSDIKIKPHTGCTINNARFEILESAICELDENTSNLCLANFQFDFDFFDFFSNRFLDRHFGKRSTVDRATRLSDPRAQ